MIDTAELTQRILAELEDKGFDDLHAILNTVVKPSGASAEVNALRQSLDEILRRQFGNIKLERMNPPELVELNERQTAELLERLSDWFRFDTSVGYWELGNGNPLKDRFPVLFLTRMGISRGREILSKRGYHWWLPRRS